MLMDADTACLLIIDVQEKLLPVMAAPDRVQANAGVLMEAAATLSVPVLASEQYPKGIGPTVPDLACRVPDGGIMEKLHFSCLGDEALAERITRAGKGQGRRQMVVAGIEAHVCVLQTTLDLIDLGYDVFVVADAVSSRSPENERLALNRMAQAGAHVVSTEMVVFEWLKKAGTDDFKKLSKLVK